MAKRAHPKPRTIRARRRSASSKPPSTGEERTQELSNYELLERRSRELQITLKARIQGMCIYPARLFLK
jgi:hypothetical protein